MSDGNITKPSIEIISDEPNCDEFNDPPQNPPAYSEIANDNQENVAITNQPTTNRFSTECELRDGSKSEKDQKMISKSMLKCKKCNYISISGSRTNLFVHMNKTHGNILENSKRMTQINLFENTSTLPMVKSDDVKEGKVENAKRMTHTNLLENTAIKSNKVKEGKMNTEFVVDTEKVNIENPVTFENPDTIENPDICSQFSQPPYNKLKSKEKSKSGHSYNYGGTPDFGYGYYGYTE